MWHFSDTWKQLWLDALLMTPVTHTYGWQCNCNWNRFAGFKTSTLPLSTLSASPGFTVGNQKAMKYIRLPKDSKTYTTTYYRVVKQYTQKCQFPFYIIYHVHVCFCVSAALYCEIKSIYSLYSHALWIQAIYLNILSRTLCKSRRDRHDGSRRAKTKLVGLPSTLESLLRRRVVPHNGCRQRILQFTRRTEL